jgi:hypothetical protein
MTRDSDFSISFSADLAEEAVLRAIAGHAEEQALRRARDPLYRFPPEDREPAFIRLHREWFFRLGLDQLFAKLRAARATGLITLEITNGYEDLQDKAEAQGPEAEYESRGRGRVMVV